MEHKTLHFVKDYNKKIACLNLILQIMYIFSKTGDLCHRKQVNIYEILYFAKT
jgi:hypothetical protein